MGVVILTKTLFELGNPPFRLPEPIFLIANQHQYFRERHRLLFTYKHSVRMLLCYGVRILGVGTSGITVILDLLAPCLCFSIDIYISNPASAFHVASIDTMLLVFLSFVGFNRIVPYRVCFRGHAEKKRKERKKSFSPAKYSYVQTPKKYEKKLANPNKCKYESKEKNKTT